MTTAAMALGVVPLIIATGAGAAARYSMGLVIFTGIVIGTIFTLFVVPMFYTFIAKRMWRVNSWRRTKRAANRPDRFRRNITETCVEPIIKGGLEIGRPLYFRRCKRRVPTHMSQYDTLIRS